MASDNLGASAIHLIAGAERGDFRALAQLLTLLEREGPKLLKAHPILLKPKRPAFRVGITGPPGAGKSTLISQLIRQLRSQGKRVGVLAVDPSSPYSQGAILGDRIRYSEHFNDAGVFIRSLGTRGSLGGLSASAYLMLRAYDLAAFDIVLIETVGVGQTELEVVNVADFVAVVLVPESGDSVQGMKAGLLEIADLYVVNKSDRPGAEIFLRELEAALHLGETGSAARCLAMVATKGQGVVEFLSVVAAAAVAADWQAARLDPARLRLEASALLRIDSERVIAERVSQISSPDDFAKIFN